MFVFKGALVSGITASAFTWPTLPPTLWPVYALWYSSLTLSLTSISAATQQAVALYRLSSVPNNLLQIRRLLGDETSTNAGHVEPRLWQLYIWQIPLLLLNTGIYAFVIGLAVLLWSAAKSMSYVWGANETKVCGVSSFEEVC